MGKTLWQIEAEQKRIAQREFKYWRKVAIDNGDIAKNGELLAGAVDRAKQEQTVTIGRFTFTVQITSIPRRSDGATWGDSAATHYQVHVSCKTDNGAKEGAYTCEYSQGSGIEGWPRARRILESVVSDALAGLADFEEFCDNFGCDPDSRQAERIHSQCRKVYKVFTRWGLNEEGIGELYQELEQE